MKQRLDIDALRTLCAIEDFGGITRASERLSLSQSAVSHKIKRLEGNIDCELLIPKAIINDLLLPIPASRLM